MSTTLGHVSPAPPSTHVKERLFIGVTEMNSKKAANPSAMAGSDRTVVTIHEFTGLIPAKLGHPALN